MAVTNNPKYARKMQLLRSHGITKEAQEFENKKGIAPWYYEQQILGYNYRLSDLHASLGISQLKRLESSIQRRNELAKIYNQELADLEITLPFVESHNYSAFHLYVILLNKHSQIKRKQLYIKLLEAKIAPQVHYIPIHLQPFYARFGFQKGDFKNAEKYSKNTLTLPLYPSLREQEQERVIAVLRKFVACK